MPVFLEHNFVPTSYLLVYMYVLEKYVKQGQLSYINFDNWYLQAPHNLETYFKRSPEDTFKLKSFYIKNNLDFMKSRKKMVFGVNFYGVPKQKEEPCNMPGESKYFLNSDFYFKFFLRKVTNK